MPRPANPQTDEARRLSEAITRAGATKAYLAELLDVTPGLISQYANGYRPVPWDRAEVLASALGIPPAEISAEYRRIQEHFGQSHPVGLDPQILAAAMRLVRLTFKHLEVPHDPEEDGVPTALAYQFLVRRGQRQVSADNVIDFTKALREQRKGESEANGFGAGGSGKSHRGARQGGQA